MNNCACVYVGDSLMPEFHNASMPKAQKEHVCDECGQVISIGEQYERVTGKWEGEINTYKTCVDCLSIRNEMFCENWCYTRLLEYLSEYVAEVKGDIPEKCLLSLTPRARGMVCDMIEEAWEEE